MGETTLKGALLAIVVAAVVALVGAANQPWWWCDMVQCHGESGGSSGSSAGGSSGGSGSGGTGAGGTSAGGTSAGGTSAGGIGSNGVGSGGTSTGGASTGSGGSSGGGSAGGSSSGGPTSTMSALETGINRGGADLSQTGTRTQSAETCAKLCADTDACKAMTFVGDLTDPGSGGICWMKGSVPEARATANMTSAVKQYQ